MRKYLFVAIVIFICSNLSFSQETTQKIGYVNSQIILNQLPEAIKAQGDINALQNKWLSHADNMTKQLQKDYAAYQKKAKTMSQDKQLEEQQKLLKQQQAIDNFKKAKFSQPNGEFYVQSDSIWEPIKAKVYKAIAVIGKQEKMNFVLDKSSNGAVLYADPKYDITYKVLDYLQRGSTK